MSELIIYILSGLTILLYLLLSGILFYVICIPMLLILLFVLYKNNKKQTDGISPFLLSGVSAVFGLIAIIFNFSAPAAVLLAIFFLFSSFIKVLFKKEKVPVERQSTLQTKNNDTKITEYHLRNESSRETELESKEDLLIHLGEKMDQSLTEIHNLLRKIDKNGMQDIEHENLLVEKIRDSITKDLNSFLNRNQEQMNSNWNKLNSLMENEIKIVNSSLEVLVNTMLENNNTQNDIQASIEMIKRKSQELPTIDVIREVVKENIKHKESSFEMKHIRNYEIKNYFYRALKEAKHEVCIISPWISKWVLTDPDIQLRFEELLQKGVNLNILYGIEGSSSSSKMDDKNARTEQVVNQLRNKLTKKRHKGKLQIGKINSHYKLFICDDEFYVESSMNILSNKGDYGEGFVWHEGGQYSENKKMLNSIKNIYFGSNNYYSSR